MLVFKLKEIKRTACIIIISVLTANIITIINYMLRTDQTFAAWKLNLEITKHYFNIPKYLYSIKIVCGNTLNVSLKRENYLRLFTTCGTLVLKNSMRYQTGRAVKEKKKKRNHM